MKKSLPEILEKFSTQFAFTARERDVLHLLIYRHTGAKEISTAMEISLSTVNNHLLSMFQKANCKGKDELMRLFLGDLIEAYNSSNLYSRKPVIILIDDEPDLNEIGIEFFQGYGIKVYAFTDPLLVPTALKSISADYVISDYRMPGMSGVELLRAIREYSRFTPAVIFLTGYSAELTLEVAMDLGAIGYFEKPTDLENVYQLIKDHFSTITREADRYRRIDLNQPGKVDEKYSLQVENIGYGGAFVSCDKPELSIEEGRVIKLSFNLPDYSKEISTLGEVVWVRAKKSPHQNFGFGVRFVSLEPEHRDAIFDFVVSRNVSSYIPKGPSVN